MRTPQSIGRYPIVRELGRGGMGIVYEARDPTLGRRVAVKLLLGSVLDTQGLERFGREAVPVQVPIGVGEGFEGVVDLLTMKATRKDGSGKASEGAVPDDLAERVAESRSALVEMVAETEDSLMEAFFEAGDLTEEVTPSDGDRYYLVVPHNTNVEGSYGRDSAGAERPPGNPTACNGTQELEPCP